METAKYLCETSGCMVHCTDCGTELQSSVKFCPECGTEVAAGSPDETTGDGELSTEGFQTKQAIAAGVMGLLVGAVVAFSFVRLARDFLPFGFGFAAGAMIYLVLTEFVPEALELGQSVPSGGKPELVGGIALGVLVMAPLAVV